MRRALAVSIACTTWLLVGPALADDSDTVASAKLLEKQKKPADAAAAWERGFDANTKSTKFLFFAAKDRQKAGTPSKAANDYARYLALAPPTEKKERAAAQKALNALTPKLGRFAIRATGSDKMSVDGEFVDPKTSENFYVTAGPHTVECVFGKAKATEQGTAIVGQQVAVVVAAPPEEEQQPAVPPPGQTASGSDSSSPSGGSSSSSSSGGKEPFKKPLPPIAVYVAGGVTVALGLGTLVSALDVQSQKATFNKSKTQANLDAGKSKESRTNILLVVTGVGALATAGMAIFLVDWQKAGITVGLGPTSGFVAGSF